MWVEILFGLVIFRIFRRFLYDDDVLEVSNSDSEAIFSVSDRIEKIYGGKVYVGLRIPDPSTGSQQNIDMVAVTKREAVVISVKNFSGLVSVDASGKWVCKAENGRKMEHYSDPVAESKRQVEILESYLDQRGVALPVGYLSCKVVLPNPKFRTIYPESFPSEVITYDRWSELKPERRHMFSDWIKGTFSGGKKDMQESIVEKLSFVLDTAPIWDRLELKNNKCIFGEFLEFKGKQDDIQSLGNIKRSKVSKVIIQRISMFGLAHSKVQVLYSLRDYRSEASSSELKEVTVRSSTDVLFQPKNSAKPHKFMLSKVASLSLSA